MTEQFCGCGDELRTDAERSSKVCDICRSLETNDLQLLLIAAMKELGEIAECIVKDDRLGHWKLELADLCGLGVGPMLALAGMDFETACEIGRSRRNAKMEMLG